MNKICGRCKNEKPKTEFYSVKVTPKTSKDGLSHWCKSCQKQSAIAWRSKNPERHRDNQRKWWEKNRASWYAKNKNVQYMRVRKCKLLRNYGITPDQYESMFRAQNGSCAICGKQNTNGEQLCVDHNHQTGKVRALLCKSCNVGIARFKDDPEVMAKAIEYINRHTEVV